MSARCGSCRPATPRVLVELADLAEAAPAVRRAARPIRRRASLDLVPAARTVLVTLDRAVTGPERVAAALRSALARRRPGPRPRRPLVELPVRYDGADLADVAALTGLTDGRGGRAGTRARVDGGVLRLRAGLRLPHRRRPGAAGAAPRRPRAPRCRPGRSALAGGFTGVYPRRIAGRLAAIGRTDAVLWDLDRDPPALLPPGHPGRFVPASRDRGAPARPADHRAGPRPARVRAPRRAAGPAPPTAASLRLANRLVGNPEGAAGLEITLGGLAARFAGRRGGRASPARPPRSGRRPDGRPARAGRGRPGDELELGVPAGGVRTYLAVRGGSTCRRCSGPGRTDLLGRARAAAVRGRDAAAGRHAGAGFPTRRPSPPVPRAAGRDRAAGPRRPARRLVHPGALATCSAPAVRGDRGQQPGRRAADAAPPLGRRRDGELPSEGMVARRGAGAARRPADRLPRRPPGDRRLPGHRRGRRGRRGARRPGPPRRPVRFRVV